jgi:type IV pilus assembly protein PilZ
MDVRVEYKTWNGFFADYRKNFSRPWTFIRTDKPFAVGTELVFQLSAPELFIEIRGLVEEVQPEGMRVCFFYRTPDERRANERLIRQHMVRELGPVLSQQLILR